MTIQQDFDSLRVSGIRKLDAANALVLQGSVSAVLTDTVKYIELDLSQTVFLDHCGLAMLITLRNKLDRRGGVVRLLNPTPAAQHILQLTRLHLVMEVVNWEENLAA